MIIVRMTRKIEEAPTGSPERTVKRAVVIERAGSVIELYKKLCKHYSGAVAEIACLWAESCKEKTYEGGSFVLVREGGIAE